MVLHLPVKKTQTTKEGQFIFPSLMYTQNSAPIQKAAMAK